MSQYLYFFNKNGDNFCPIGAFGRNSVMAENFCDAPYGKITFLSREAYLEKMCIIDELIQDNKNSIAENDKEIDFLRTANGPFDERMDKVAFRLEANKYRNEEIEDLEYVKNILQVYMNVVNQAVSGSNIYYGVENYTPTYEDVV